MKKLIAVLILGLSVWACQMVKCDNASNCTIVDNDQLGPSGVPSPSPTLFPSPGTTPDPCLIESIQISIHSGVQLPFLALGETHQLDATPYNSGGKVADGCNVTRSVSWSALTPQTCQVIGSGFNPFLRGLRVGSCSVTASIGNVQAAPFSVEVR